MLVIIDLAGSREVSSIDHNITTLNGSIRASKHRDTQLHAANTQASTNTIQCSNVAKTSVETTNQTQNSIQIKTSKSLTSSNHNQVKNVNSSSTSSNLATHLNQSSQEETNSIPSQSQSSPSNSLNSLSNQSNISIPNTVSQSAESEQISPSNLDNNKPFSPSSSGIFDCELNLHSSSNSNSPSPLINDPSITHHNQTSCEVSPSNSNVEDESSDPNLTYHQTHNSRYLHNKRENSRYDFSHPKLATQITYTFYWLEKEEQPNLQNTADPTNETWTNHSSKTNSTEQVDEEEGEDEQNNTKTTETNNNQPQTLQNTNHKYSHRTKIQTEFDFYTETLPSNNTDNELKIFLDNLEHKIRKIYNQRKQKVEKIQAENDHQEGQKTTQDSAHENSTLSSSHTKFSESIGLAVFGGENLRQKLHGAAGKLNLRPLPDIFHTYIDLLKHYQSTFPNSNSSFNYLANKYGKDINTDSSHSISEDATTDAEKRLQIYCNLVTACLRRGKKFRNPEKVNTHVESSQPILNSMTVKPDTVVRIRGLPWQCSDHDVGKFFSGLNIPRGGVSLQLTETGRRSGEALVRFETVEQREMALKRHREPMGNRYIEVFRASHQDFYIIACNPSSEATNFMKYRENAAVVRLRGLPYSCSEEDVVKFFEDTEPNVKVYSTLDKENNERIGVLFIRKGIENKPTGDAFVLFETEELAGLALKKHREEIEDKSSETSKKRYVEVFRSTAAELHQVVTRQNYVNNQQAMQQAQAVQQPQHQTHIGYHHSNHHHHHPQQHQYSQHQLNQTYPHQARKNFQDHKNNTSNQHQTSEALLSQSRNESPLYPSFTRDSSLDYSKNQNSNIYESINQMYSFQTNQHSNQHSNNNNNTSNNTSNSSVKNSLGHQKTQNQSCNLQSNQNQNLNSSQVSSQANHQLLALQSQLSKVSLTSSLPTSLISQNNNVTNTNFNLGSESPILDFSSCVDQKSSEENNNTKDEPIIRDASFYWER